MTLAITTIGFIVTVSPFRVTSQNFVTGSTYPDVVIHSIGSGVDSITAVVGIFMRIKSISLKQVSLERMYGYLHLHSHPMRGVNDASDAVVSGAHD